MKRVCRLIVALTLCAAGAASAGAGSASAGQLPFLTQAAPRPFFELDAGGATLTSDSSGKLLGVAAAATEPVARVDAQSLAAAQAIAWRRAVEAYAAFMKRTQPVEAIAAEIERARAASSAPAGAGEAALSSEALRALAAELAAARQRDASEGLGPQLFVESGYQADRKAAWARVSVGQRPRRPTWAGAEPAAALGGVVGSPAGAERAAALGAAVGSLPVAPAPRGTPLAVGGRIQPPLKIYHVPPVYPSIAQAARVQGTVVVRLVIAPDGSVYDAAVEQSIPLLDQAALDAVRQWAFTPTLVDGQAVPVIFRVHVNFTLSARR